MMLSFTLILACWLSHVQAIAPDNLELVLTEILFRHGARTTYRFYPTDPHKNLTFYPIGFGGLTNEGKIGEYKLGEFLKDYYRDFLGDTYSHELIEMRSTDVTRTKMSALLVLAGMWPPTKEQQWHPTLIWQPIPIIVKPRKEEDILSPINCPYRRKVLSEQPANPEVQKKFINPHKQTFEYIKKHAKFEVNNPIDALEFLFIVSTESEMNLTLPNWTKKIYPEPLTSIAAQVYGYWNYESQLKKIHAGSFLKKILNEFKEKTAATLLPANRKMFLYAGHESTLGYLLNALDLTEPHIPPYGSAVMFELLKDKQNYYFVKIKYHTELGKPVALLKMPQCGSICPIEQFSKINEFLLPEQSYKQMCGL